MSLAQESTPTRAQFTENGRYYFDFIRVLATHLVVIGHTGALFGLTRPLESGGLGVVLFFLLSGFLIVAAGLRRWDSAEDQFGSFMIDRFARIFVPFVPILVGVAVVNVLFELGDHGQMGINTGPLAFVANALLLNDYPVFQAASRAVDVTEFFPRSYNSAEPFWTLPLEFWTYVVFALFLFGFMRREALNRWLVVTLLAVAMPVFLWNSFAGGGGCLTLVWVLGATIGYLWFTHIDEARETPTVGWLMLVAGAVAWAGRVMKAGYDPYEFQQVVFVALALFGAFLLLNAGGPAGDRSLAGRAFIGRSLISRSGRIFGRMMTLLASYSYSLFLVHNTVIVIFAETLAGPLGAAAPVLAVVTAHLVAFLFYLAFERHYHKVGRWLKDRLRERAARGSMVGLGTTTPQE